MVLFEHQTPDHCTTNFSNEPLASVEADDQRLPHPRDDQFMAGVRADGTVQERAAILLGRTPRARWPLGLKAWAIRAWVDPDPYGEVPRGCRSVKICVAFGDDPDAPPVEFCADAVVAKRTADRITRSRRVSAETIPMMWPRSMRVALYEIAAAWRNNMAAEIIGANQVGAYRVSRSPYLAEVSGLWRRSDASSATLDGLMCLQVPFLRGATPRLLMDARENCWRSLEALRDHLDRAVGELRAEPNEGRMAARAKAITREIQHRQVRELDRAVASLRPVILAKVATGVATLAAAIVGNRNPIVATAIAALVGAQTFLEYRAHVSRSPAFFLLRASGGRRLDPESG